MINNNKWDIQKAKIMYNMHVAMYPFYIINDELKKKNNCNFMRVWI